MEPTQETLSELRLQEQALCDEIDALEAAISSSANASVREFRMTRLRQLQIQRMELSARLTRLQNVSGTQAEAYLLSNALREATRVAQGTLIGLR